jgi:N-acetyl-anhydromuramyl-L-alanine amidase AmpD
MKRIVKSSPNCNGRGSHTPSIIVLHCDASDNVSATLSWLASKESKVSYHVVIDRDGTAYEVVPVGKRAWHAGVSSFAGITDVNSHSIGLSFANKNDGKEPYTAAQVESARVLCREWMKAFPKITKDRITTHALIAPTRKTDPKGFDLAAFTASL